jgi:DNA-binding XRE family transcriptional regulator
MPKESLTEKDLAALAKRLRTQAGKKRAEAARDMGVSQTSIFNAEESPERGLARLRVRMIEAYSRFQVVGPVYFLRRR